jgi:hypothetical protein
MTDYNGQTNKTTEGMPTQYFFDRQYTPQIYLWPVPENSTDTVVYWSVSQTEDITASYQDTDIPYRWTEAMCAGLASKLALKLPNVPPQRLQILLTQAESAFQFASDEEGEKAALRCGLSYSYLSLRLEWNGLRTCQDCWEPKHPALDPVVVTDVEALRFPRPSTHKREDARVVLTSGVSTYGRMGPDGSALIGRSDSVFTATGVSTTGAMASSNSAVATALPSGVSTTTAVGNESVLVGAIIAGTGVSTTTAIGEHGRTIQTYAEPDGIAVTTAVGNETIRADAILSVSGVSTTLGLGNETPQAAAVETGFAITTAVGNESIRRLGWGNAGWGDDNWGHD